MAASAAAAAGGVVALVEEEEEEEDYSDNGIVAGRVIDSSLESSSLFSILAGEREDSSLLSKARAYLGLVFHLNRDFSPRFWH
jgi:hypothetical protein